VGTVDSLWVRARELEALRFFFVKDLVRPSFVSTHRGGSPVVPVMVESIELASELASFRTKMCEVTLVEPTNVSGFRIISR